MSKITFKNEALLNAAFAQKNCTYTQFAQGLKDVALGIYEEGVSKRQANEDIRETFAAILGLDKNPSRKQIKRALRSNGYALFEVIEETIDDLLTSGWQDNEFFTRFVDIRNLALGDTNEFYTRDDIVLNVSKVSGNHHDILRQRLNEGEAYHVPMQHLAVKVYSDLELLLANRIDWSDLVLRVYDAIDQEVSSMVFTSFMSMDEAVTPTDQFVLTGTLDSTSKATFLKLITDVQAANRGSRIIIVGTKVALSNLYDISDVDWIAESSKEERKNLGRIGIWEGTDIMELPQVFKKGTTDYMVDDAKLLILPDVDWKPIKLVYEGDIEITEVTDSADNQDMSNSYEYITKLGVGTVVNRKFGTWTIEE